MTRATNRLGRHDLTKTVALVVMVVGVIRDPSWIQWAQDMSTLIAYKVAYDFGAPAEPTRVYEMVKIVLGVGAVLVGLSLLWSALRVLRAFGRLGRSANPTPADRAEPRPPHPKPSAPSRSVQPRLPEPATPAPSRQPTVSPHAPMRDAWFPQFVIIAILLFIVASLVRWGVS